MGIQRAGGEAFVPRPAVSGSLLLGLAGVGVLMCFIHHLARSIQIDAIMSTVRRETRWVILELYPDRSGYLEPEERCPDPPAWAVAVPAGRLPAARHRPDPPVRSQGAGRGPRLIQLLKNVWGRAVQADGAAALAALGADRPQLADD